MKCKPCSTIPLGDLRHRATLQKAPTSLDADGKPTGDWTDVAEIWCGIKPLRGRELFNAQQAQSRTTHRVMMHYRSDVSSKNRIVYRSRNLNIDEAINIDEQGRWLELLCYEAS